MHAICAFSYFRISGGSRIFEKEMRTSLLPSISLSFTPLHFMFSAPFPRPFLLLVLFPLPTTLPFLWPPLNSARGVGERCKLPRGSWQRWMRPNYPYPLASATAYDPIVLRVSITNLLKLKFHWRYTTDTLPSKPILHAAEQTNKWSQLYFSYTFSNSKLFINT